MKRIELFLLFTSIALSANSQIIERLGVSGPLKFKESTFSLAWTANPRPNYYVQEYLPEGQKVDSFNEMITIHVFTSDIDPKIAVQQKITELNIRKKTDKVMQYQVNESPDGKEFILDCILSAGTKKEIHTVEFILYKYQQIDLTGKKALLVYSYSKRSYNDDVLPFLETLNSYRITYLNEMIEADIPVIKL